MGVQNIFAPAAIKVNIMRHAGFIELIQQLLQGLLIPSAAERIAEMIMRVDNREFRFIHQGGFGDKLRCGAKVFEKHHSPLCNNDFDTQLSQRLNELHICRFICYQGMRGIHGASSAGKPVHLVWSAVIMTSRPILRMARSVRLPANNSSVHAPANAARTDDHFVHASASACSVITTNDSSRRSMPPRNDRDLPDASQCI
jgi:hypothetical protein